MIKFLKTASLKHDNETKAMLINLILRNFLADGEVDQAFDFVNKVDFPNWSRIKLTRGKVLFLPLED